MKNLTYFFIIVLFVSFNVNAQDRMERMKDGKKKLEQLEKIKLIEALQMNEETTLKFFSRKSELDRKVDQLRDEQRNIIDNMNTMIKKDSAENHQDYNKLINKFIKNDKKIDDEKRDFILSLSDILSKKQIAHFITFKAQWREDIRRLLMHQKFKKSN